MQASAEDFDATRRDDGPGCEDRAGAELPARRVLAALAKLDREQRVLLALHAESYSLAELATITDLSTDVLKARLYRARVRLGKLLAVRAGAPAPLPTVK